MRAIYQNTVIHIDITNACHLACANCTRHVGHHRKPYFMDPDVVRQSIVSLLDFPGRIGIMGGEPTLHPKFRDILALMRELVPRRKREFWTAGFKWELYKDDILDTFDEDRISFNDHTQATGAHQPLLVAIEEVVEDPELRKMLIDNCPFQAHWSASITPKGAFFCEIAASMDWLFDGPGGYAIEPGWWRRTPEDFQDQVNEWCGKCSGAIPMGKFSDNRGGREKPSTDVVSPGNLDRLLAAGSPRAIGGYVDVEADPMTYDMIKAKKEGWNPREFRAFEAHTPEDVEKGKALTE
jgi:hypothetical protein